MANLNREQLRRLARLGAMARLSQIREEEAAIRGEFPELFAGRGASRGRGGRRRSSGGAAAAAGRAARGGRRRKRKGMSAAARKAASERMRKYWAERRQAKAK